MNGPVTADGLLGLHPVGGEQLGIAYFPDSLGPDLCERLVGSEDPRALVLGRSVLGQIGLDIQAAGKPIIDDSKQPRLWQPINLKTYTPVASALADDVYELASGKSASSGSLLKWQDRELPFGRFADMSQLIRLETPEQIQTVIEDALIHFDPNFDGTDNTKKPYRLHEDGSVSVKLSSLEFILDEEHLLSTPENRIGLLHEGRSGIIRNCDTKPRDSSDLLPDFLLGGIVFSPGPYYWSVRTLNSDPFGQLPSAALFDGNRLAGVGTHLPVYDRNRQVELVMRGKDKISYEDTWVRVDIFASSQVESSPHLATDWWRMPVEDRINRHLRGITALEALETANPANRNALLGLAKRNDAALVLSRRGLKIVPKSWSDKFNLTHTGVALTNAESGISSELSDAERRETSKLIDDLGSAGDRTATVIDPSIRLSDLPGLVTAGARAFLFERFRKSDESLAMTKGEIEKLAELSREGIGIAWSHNGDYREFHPSGLWVKPEATKRLEKLELVLAMYGSHMPQADTGLYEKVYKFVGQLPNTLELDPYNIAIAHGNGPELMLAFHEAAMMHKLMSIGVSIDFENIGQGGVNWGPHAIALQVSRDRLNRQHMLDVFNTISIFNRGGLGTLEEHFITLCSQKLYEGLPVPKILIQGDDEPDPEHGLYSDIPRLVSKICKANLAPAWVENTLHLVDTYEEVLELLAAFMDDPISYWENAGLNRAEIKTSLDKQVETHRFIGFNPHTRLVRKAESYINRS